MCRVMHVGDGQRDQHRHHEDAGRGIDAELRVGGEEQHQRPDVEDELERGMELLLGGHDFFFMIGVVRHLSVMPAKAGDPALVSRE